MLYFEDVYFGNIWCFNFYLFDFFYLCYLLCSKFNRVEFDIYVYLLSIILKVIEDLIEKNLYCVDYLVVLLFRFYVN